MSGNEICSHDFFRLPYGTFMGGCVAMDKKTIESINGLSNIMFGWGGEDDNTYAR